RLTEHGSSSGRLPIRWTILSMASHCCTRSANPNRNLSTRQQSRRDFDRCSPALRAGWSDSVRIDSPSAKPPSACYLNLFSGAMALGQRPVLDLAASCAVRIDLTDFHVIKACIVSDDGPVVMAGPRPQQCRIADLRLRVAPVRIELEHRLAQPLFRQVCP